MAASFVHGGGIACIRRRFGQRFGTGFIGVIGDDGHLLGQIDLDGTHAGQLLQRFLDRDRTYRTGHVLHVEPDGF